MDRRKMRTTDFVYCALFATLIAVGAFIKIPVPYVPFTLQTLFTLLAGLLLGAKRGCISAVVYMLVGLLGIPVFAEGGGIWYVIKPSFGYIVGFCFAAYLTGFMTERYRTLTFRNLILACFAGLTVIYVIGLVYYYVICNYVIAAPIGLWPLVLYCFLLVVPGDILLCVLAAALAKRLIPAVKKYGV